MTSDYRSLAIPWEKGRLYEDFMEGEFRTHHWGRTITEADAILFSTLTLAFNPLYTNRAYALAHGHRDIVVNPLLVFNTVLGLSVQDNSEIGGPFLGVEDLSHHRPFYPGDTIVASSTTKAKRITSDPSRGVVTWHTVGHNQSGELVIEFDRSNIVRLRHPAKEG